MVLSIGYILSSIQEKIDILYLSALAAASE